VSRRRRNDGSQDNMDFLFINVSDKVQQCYPTIKGKVVCQCSSAIHLLYNIAIALACVLTPSSKNR
jgi:hypothetical protein